MTLNPPNEFQKGFMVEQRSLPRAIWCDAYLLEGKEYTASPFDIGTT